MKEVEINCPLCDQKHVILLNEEQQEGTEKFLLQCSNLDRRYRLSSFQVDTTRNILRTSVDSLDIIRVQIINQLKEELGEYDFDNKFKRWKSIDYPVIGIIEEYPEKLKQIIHTYSSGYSYSATTSACCIAERVLNRLVLKCRGYFKTDPGYKNIYKKKSFNNWEQAIVLIRRWELIPEQSITLFEELEKYRNDSVHYNDGYDFDVIAPVVINKLISLIKEIFGVENRVDLYLVFDIPGEIWIRSGVENLPFVKEFVLPHCYHAYAIHEIDTINNKIIEKKGKMGEITDEEFVKLRIDSTRLIG